MHQMQNLGQHLFGDRRDEPIQHPTLRVEGARVLVADDDEDLRNLHAAILELGGYEVSVAANGADALEQLSAAQFNLLLTDRQMPVLDGESLVVSMRSAGINIPVVMLSGSFSHRPLRQRVATEVAIGLPKPTLAAAVLAAVYLALSGNVPAVAVAA